MRFAGVAVVFILLFGLVGISRSWLAPKGSSASWGQAVGSAAHGAPVGTGRHRYRLRLTSTFEAAQDPFALRSADDTPPVRLLVRSGGQILHQRTADWRRGEPVILEAVALQGEAVDLFVMATPSESEMQSACGVRVEIFQEDGVVCDDQTLWAEPGMVISRRALFSLRPGMVPARHSGANHGEERTE